jgi:hypothetical protein
MNKDMPAFPTGIFTDDRGVVIGGSYGMTLRDYFASKAMQGFMGSSWNVKSFEEMATKAYELADAMMKAREQ